MKVFLSHKMSGLSDSEIMKIREDATKVLIEKYGDVEIIDNYHHDGAPDNAGRVWHLGTSISQMDKADAIYFCDGNTYTNGCMIEMMVASLYNLRVLNTENEPIKSLNSNIAASEVITSDFNDLLSSEDYDKYYAHGIHKYSTNGLYITYSEPKYRCDKCGGGMCKNETIVYASIPPKYEYKCNKCGNIEYKPF